MPSDAGVVRELTDDTFDEVLTRTDRPFLVAFSSPWCAPCAALHPVLAELAAERADDLAVGTVDVVSQAVTTARFDVRSTPTLIVFRGGVAVRRVRGSLGKRQLAEQLAALDGPS